MQNPSRDKTPPGKDPPKVVLNRELIDQMRRRRQMLEDLRKWSEARQTQEVPCE
jgi:hypothetical protein